MKSMVFSGLYGEVMYGEHSWLGHINCLLYKIHFFKFWLTGGYLLLSVRDSNILLCFLLSDFTLFYTYSCLIQHVREVSAHSVGEIVDSSLLQLSALKHGASWRWPFTLATFPILLGFRCWGDKLRQWKFISCLMCGWSVCSTSL